MTKRANNRKRASAMPKLPKAVQKAAEEAESSSFEALPEGKYLCQLDEVKTDGSGKAGPYWTWVWKIHEDNGSFAGRLLWDTVSLSVDWKVKQVFEALGFSLDSDTDEMIGEKAWLVVSQRVIEGGKRQGEMGNSVDVVLGFEEGAQEGDDVF